ncbi:MAG TPA: hypothetical protein VES42_19260, partial [Pilimelia sp.]|nr:hypothetical protein [Pilimelia sp.]
RASVVWAPARVGGGPVDGYRVVRLPADADSPVAAGGGCAGVLAEAHCVESDVPHGVWRYAVRAVHGVRWQGPRGGPSDPVTVGGPKAPQEAAAADTATAGTATAGTAAVGTAAGQPGTADPGAGGQPANGPTAAPTGEHTGAPSAGTDEPGAGAGRESTGDQVDPNGQTGTATPVDPATTDNQTPSPDSRVIGS